MAGKKGMKWARKIGDPETVAELRTRIEGAKILNRLKAHTLGQVEMSPTQVQAGIALLRKVLPDTSEQTITADVKHEHRIADEGVLGRLVPEAANRLEVVTPQEPSVH